MKFYIAALFLLLGCLALMNGLSNRSPDFEHAHSRIQKKIIKQLCRDYGLTCTATGGGNDREGRWRALDLGFHVKKSMDVDEARVFFVHCMEDILTTINSVEAIRPSLVNNQFTNENVLLMIFTHQPSGQEVYEPDIGGVSSLHKDVVYKVCRREPDSRLREIYREPYLEALRIVREQEGW